MTDAASALPLVDVRDIQTGRRSSHKIAYWPGVIDLARTGDDIAYQVEKQVRAKDVHESDFELLRGLASQKASLLDAGANCGQTILSTKAICPDLQVHSVEPNPFAWPYLEEVAKRFSQVTVGCYGLSESWEQLTLWVPVIDGLLVTPLGSAHPDIFLVDPMKSWLIEIAGGVPVRFTSIVITLRRGDDLRLSPDVIKIDVEHHELSVIRGLAETIGRSRPLLIIEKSKPFQISQFLGTLSYGLFQFVAPSKLYRLNIDSETASSSLPLNLIGFPEEGLGNWTDRLGLRVMA